MATAAQQIAAAINTINQLTQFTIRNNTGTPSSEFARSFKAAMQELAGAVQALNDLVATNLTTLANVGAGAGIFRDKTGTIANLRSLVAGANITLTQNADDIEVAASSGGGSTTNNVVSLNGESGAVNLTLAQLGGFGLVTYTEINGDFGGGGVTALNLPADDGSLVPGLIVVLSIEGQVGIPTTLVVPPGGGALQPPPTANFTTGVDGLLLTLRYNGADVWSYLGAVVGNNPV